MGETASAAVDFYCDRSTLVDDPDKYSEALVKIFGIGAKILEDIIIMELYTQLNIQYKKNINRRFSEYITEAEEIFRSK